MKITTKYFTKIKVNKIYTNYLKNVIKTKTLQQ
jgi:hypothetical protein